jgi:hypothetical protein
MKLYFGKTALIGVFTVATISGCGTSKHGSNQPGARLGLEDSRGGHHGENEQENEAENRGHNGNHQEHPRAGDDSSDDSDDSTHRQLIKNPGNQTSIVGTSVEITLEKSSAEDDDAYEFSATGLPSGLSLDKVSGKITGVVGAAPGIYTVSIIAKEIEDRESGENHVAAKLQFTWTVTEQ